MKVYIQRKNGIVDAVAEYDVETKSCTVLKGSIVSSSIAQSAKFRGAASIEKARKDTVKNNKVIVDVPFKSASTAANYVTGTSTNGLVAWKNEKGQSIKDIIKEDE